MQANYLCLVRRPDRRRAFLDRLPRCVTPRWLDTYDGPVLGRDWCREIGIDLDRYGYFTQATAANYYSHKLAWAEAAAGREPYTIAEDDVVFHPEFAEVAAAVLDSLPDAWDACYWGWSLSAWASLELWPGGPSFSVRAIGIAECDWRASFPASYPYAAPLRTWGLYNSHAYTLSPAGAQKLLDRAWPPPYGNLSIPLYDSLGPIYGVDAAMASQHAGMVAYVTFPHLAIHLHDANDSDMLPDGAPIRDTRISPKPETPYRPFDPRCPIWLPPDLAKHLESPGNTTPPN